MRLTFEQRQHLKRALSEHRHATVAPVAARVGYGFALIDADMALAELDAPPAAAPHPCRTRYRTHAARVEAKRRSWRLSKRRAYAARMGYDVANLNDWLNTKAAA